MVFFFRQISYDKINIILYNKHEVILWKKNIKKPCK
nr:MAG TPA: hypothetical protein [Caudoviricetes sp.]